MQVSKMKMQYIFSGGLIPYGAIVKVIKFLKQRKSIIEYKGKRYCTMTRLLRHLHQQTKLIT